MMLQGVCAAMSGGEKRWSVLPFFVIGVVVDGLDDDDGQSPNTTNTIVLGASGINI